MRLIGLHRNSAWQNLALRSTGNMSYELSFAGEVVDSHPVRK